MRCFALALLFVLLASNVAPAQALNPDISFIGDARFRWSDVETNGEQEELAFHELEIALVGPLNPYASTEAYVAIHGTEGIEVEEAKLILDRYFPGGFGLTAGHMLLDFGQINTIHSHAYPWVDRPIMHEEFFGEDGARDTAVRLDWIAPTEGINVRATLGAVRGDALLGGHHDEGEEVAEEPTPELGASARLALFAEPSAAFSIQLGASALHGTFDPDEDAQATWIDVDAKAKWDMGPNRSLVLNGEGAFGDRDETTETPASKPRGFFGSADLRLNKRWNVGGFAESAEEVEDDDATTVRWGGFAGLALMEETTVFRVMGRVTDPEAGEDVADAIVQAIFALGPHKPHRY